MSTHLPVLTFHDISPEPAVIAFSPAVLELSLTRLCSAGYRTIALAEVAERLRAHEPFPDRTFAITFDDAYESVYRVAFPLLQRLGLTATVFVAVGPASEVGDERPTPWRGRTVMSWAGMSEMTRYGFSFGAHSLTHADLTLLSVQDAEHEIWRSKQVLEERLGVAVGAFAYPEGSYNSLVRELAQRYVGCACSDRLAFVGPGSDLFALPRVDMYYLRHSRLAMALATPWFGPYIAACSVPRGVRRALRASRLR